MTGYEKNANYNFPQLRIEPGFFHVPDKRTNHCTIQLVALSTICWYYIPKITTVDCIIYWYGRKLLALHTHIVQKRIHCAYQKIHVFSLILNFSLQLASIAV